VTHDSFLIADFIAIQNLPIISIVWHLF